MIRWLIVALLLVLTAGAAAATEPIELMVLEPREGSLVHADVAQVVVELPEGVSGLAWFAVYLDDRLLARSCVARSTTATQCAFFNVGVASAVRDKWRIALRPELAVLAPLAGPIARHVYAQQVGTLGYLRPGDHVLRLDLHEQITMFAPEASTPIATKTVQFRVAANKRIALVYDNQYPAAEIVNGSAVQPGLGPNQGGMRQVARTSVSPWAFSRLNGKLLAKQSGPEMANTLRRAIERSCGAKPRRRLPTHCAGSGYVSVDEITPDFADWNARTRAERNRESPGARLAEALFLLDRRSPWEFSYASRVHLFISPGVMTALGAPRVSGWRFGQVAPALVRSGGVWLEMYRGTAGYGAEAFSQQLWTRSPAAAVRLLRSSGGDASNLHFLMTRGISVPRVRDRFGSVCVTAMACQWALAERTAVNRRILANGVGAYRTSDQASQWLAEYNRRF